MLVGDLSPRVSPSRNPRRKEWRDSTVDKQEENPAERLQLSSYKNYIEYTKGSVNIYCETKLLLEAAQKKNAKLIQRYQLDGNPQGTPIYNLNPYSNLNELIEEIEKLHNIE